ncbi:MmgE/PrpD family protein [Pseudoroseomonas wenyumeiae]|uniref:MmgE/PrpD family protein n=1 Tax=Teichococcus wenyumeiae TaxID=2478470 RepID=A0A3A9JFN8_9PROT|nr:MmgE/PrpD family protein [Pseudoroseomonas wenyumeiae]RKK05402.1 MmgE/PrpD family protein [Pseudoroseomonas wenyumeiae]RMI19121.1 MmgE/PrpD family protein [Pseudoroseomonas wenyumeiae]
MTIVTPGVLPASVLLRQAGPAWLDQWSRFAATLRPADLPAEARDRAKLVLLDSIGVMASGMQEPELRALLPRLAATQAGTVPAIGGGLSLAPGAAAFANGTAGTMLELDEGNQYARGHPGIHVVPAVLAAAQGRDFGGDRLLAALALGYEIGSRIGIASKLRVTMHPHGTWGTVGAALAVAYLHGANAAQMREVINIASSFGLSTSRRTMLEGATVRNTYAGLSNQLGLLAWDLAQSGFVGEADGIGAVYGGIIAEDFQPEAMTEDLGTRWEIARNYFKRHAACRYTHGALDALAIIMAQGPLAPRDIERIEVDTYVWAAQLDLPRPRNMLSAKFSLPFALATTIVHGAATVPAFREPALREAETLALAERVVVREDPALTARLPGLRPARLRVLLRDGTMREAAVETNRGDTEDPYDAAEITAKFHELADPVWGRAHARRLAEAVTTMDGAASAAPLHMLLAQAPAGEYA